MRGFSDNVQSLSGFYASEAMGRCLNRPLEAIELAPNKSVITFRFQDGGWQRFSVEGDCCSSSWIEHFTAPENVAGAVITDVSEDMQEAPSTEEYECLKVYQTHFETDRGRITLEYRNSSNGYYGGYLQDAGCEEASS